ncbi:hypothetical protein DJ568_06995 [Mucilaginibacter hurinus]|uniref:DUF4270 domain-containing protein n=1 Tax=Mucilaginibacter hurinus TaxID=2201324 RepID=A0A367GQ94_9SPHI|nr:DUF4270 family protein [Mucilaginibacter hurinus]RCH55627.1 hypothetical protein DJ568_06995 [Mucilaginibacter hurinus]
MKFFRLDLLTLLISLFILNGCKNPDGVGLGVDNGLSGTVYADTTVMLNTMREDSVQVGNLARTPLAYFNDPELGLTQSSIVTNINLPLLSKYTIPTGTIDIDSAILSIKYNSAGFYGDSVNSMYKVNVFQLNEKPVASTVYYNTKNWLYNTTDVWGTKTFKARPHDTLKVFSIIKGKPDTLVRVLPQLRIPLNTARIREVLFTAGNQLNSNDNFQTAVKGFYVKLDEAGTTGTGGILTFGLPDTLSVYIRVNNGTTMDTSVVSLPITRHIADIKHTYSENVLTALTNQTESNTKAYVQGMGGLRVKVSFPGLQSLIDMKNDIIINRAELVVTPYPGSIIPYAPLPNLMMYKFDLAKQRTFIEDMTGSYSALFGGRLGLPVKNEYRFLLTNYIQNLVLGKTKDYGTFIGAANESAQSAADVNATGYPIARTILAGKNSPFRVKLNIIYTRIK